MAALKCVFKFGGLRTLPLSFTLFQTRRSRHRNSEGCGREIRWPFICADEFVPVSCLPGIERLLCFAPMRGSWLSLLSCNKNVWVHLLTSRVSPDLNPLDSCLERLVRSSAKAVNGCRHAWRLEGCHRGYMERFASRNNQKYPAAEVPSHHCDPHQGRSYRSRL